MFRLLLPSVRLSFALVCVGASVLMAAQWFGVLPDTVEQQRRARQNEVEVIGGSVLADVRGGNWEHADRYLQSLADRRDDLHSIGVRTHLGALRLVTKDHRRWYRRTESPGDASTELVTVPIRQGGAVWGRLEFIYDRLSRPGWRGYVDQPSIRLMLFFFIAGLPAYTTLVVRLFGVFQSTQVVPERVRSALDTLAEGLLLLDETGQIVFANQAFGTGVRRDSQTLKGEPASVLPWCTSNAKPIEDVATSDPADHVDDAPDYFPWDAAVTGEAVVTGQTLRLRLSGGGIRIFNVNATPLGGEDRSGGGGTGALVTFHDITHEEEHRAELENMLRLLGESRDEIEQKNREVEQKNRELEILATRDSLTACLNRRAFFEIFADAWTDARRDQTPLSVIMMDNDHFKNVNDTYGHHIGDEVLRRVSATVRERFDSIGHVCRYGGEEFCVLLPGVSLQKAAELAEVARKDIMAIRLSDPAELRLSASIGVSELRMGADEPQTLVNQADECLYVAKREGRNRVIVYNPSIPAANEAAEADANDRFASVDLSFQAVTALMSALSYRDAKTGEHSRRVANLCAAASDGLLNPVDTYVLEVAAMLHDIGKIGVPDAILNKPGKLNDIEWEIMGRHDVIGHEIVQGALGCEPLSEIVINHHAFFGGKGRHEELPTGHAIPIGARLLAIADAYDAMTSDRVYRPGMPIPQAVAELRRCAGSQFDPVLVDHFIEKLGLDEPTTATTAAGADRIRRRLTTDLGTSMERIVDALSINDYDRLRRGVDGLAGLATHAGLDEIGDGVTRLQAQLSTAEEDERLILRDTHDLIDLCRTAQRRFLQASLHERNAEHAPAPAER